MTSTTVTPPILQKIPDLVYAWIRQAAADIRAAERLRGGW